MDGTLTVRNPGEGQQAMDVRVLSMLPCDRAVAGPPTWAQPGAHRALRVNSPTISTALAARSLAGQCQGSEEAERG